MFRIIRLNLARHKLKTVLGASGIAVGVVLMVMIAALVEGLLGRFENSLGRQSHLVVTAVNSQEVYASNFSADALPKIQALPQVKRCYPLVFGFASSLQRPVLSIVGIELNTPVLTTSEWLTGKLELWQRGSVVLGQRLSEQLGKNAKSMQLNGVDYPVAGVIVSDNPLENAAVFMHIDDARDLLGKQGRLSGMQIELRDAGRSDEVAALINAKPWGLKAQTNTQYSRGSRQFKTLSSSAMVISWVAVLLGGFSVFNSMLMSVFVRMRELAIMRVCGFSRWQVLLLVIGEALGMAVLGCAIGVLIAWCALHGLAASDFGKDVISANLSMANLLKAAAFAFLSSILGSLYPALYTLKVTPAQALSYE